MAAAQSKVRVSGLRMELETYSTGATQTTTPAIPVPGAGYPSFLGFDDMQSFYVDVEAKPSENVTGTLSVNILGNVPENPMDEVFYENRGRRRDITQETPGDTLSATNVFTEESLERVKVYQAYLTWDDKWFELNAFYRTGHLHWGHEGAVFDGRYHRLQRICFCRHQDF